VWKFQDFCITEILREINFVDSRSAKTADFPFLKIKKGCEFWSFGTFQPSKNAIIHKNQNSEPLNVVKWLILPLKILKIEFT